MRQANVLQGKAAWPSIGPLSLNGADHGDLAQFAQNDPTLTVMILADLRSHPLAHLDLGLNGNAGLPTAFWSLTNTQSIVVTIGTGQYISWALTDAAGAPVSGGAVDYLRATAYL